jgi:hypothetical protein
VVAVQKVGFGTRCIVNVGTIDAPVYKSLPGELGRGFGLELATKFPLKMPVNLRNRKPTHIKSLLAIFEVESTSTKRAPITKIQVQWNKLSGFEKAETVEWLSRSDVISICGKQWTERQGQVLLQN